MRKWLKKIRVSKGYTQEQLAELIGISRCYYTQIESDVVMRSMHPNVAMKIAKVLDCDWTWFFDEKRIPETING